MSNPEFHTCPTCGYTWQHGQHGGHSCVERLVKQRDELLSALKTAAMAFESRGNTGDAYQARAAIAIVEGGK